MKGLREDSLIQIKKEKRERKGHLAGGLLGIL